MWHDLTEEEAIKVKRAFKAELFGRHGRTVCCMYFAVAVAVMLIIAFSVDGPGEPGEYFISFLGPGVLFIIMFLLSRKYRFAKRNFARRTARCIVVRVADKKVIRPRYKRRYDVKHGITVTNLYGPPDAYVQDLMISYNTYRKFQQGDVALLIYFDSPDNLAFNRDNAYVVPFTPGQ